MAMPWEEYGAQPAESGPWTEYAAAQPQASGPPPSRTEKLTTGLADPIHGAAQLLTNMLPDGVVRAGNAANNWLADKTGLVPRLPEGGVDQQVRQREADYQARRTAGGESGFDGYRVLGNVFSPANVAIAARTPQAVSMLGRMGIGAASGAVSSGLNPITGGGDFMDEKLAQTGTGAAFGAAVAPVVGGLARLVSPKASVDPNVQLLKREGVTPTIGQALGGRWNALEEKAMSLPIVGDFIAGARNRSLEQFDNAAINRAVAPIGKRVDGVGQKAIKEAGDLLSDAYDDAKTALGSFRVDRQASQELGTLQTLASGLGGRERRAFDTFIKDNIQGKTAFTPDAFKELDSKIGTEAARYGKASDAYQQKLGDAFKEMQRIFMDNARRANPQAAAKLDKADAGWAQLVRLEQAGKSAKNAEGVFTPGQFNMAIAAKDGSTRGRAVARGTALGQDLGNAGQTVLGNKVPNSFTTDRALIAGGGLGSYFIDPMIPTGLLGAGLLYTKPMQGLLSGAATARPQLAQPVADALRKASPGLIPLGAQVGLGLLN